MEWIKAFCGNPRNFVKAKVKTHAISYMDGAENQGDQIMQHIWLIAEFVVNLR